MNEPGLYHQLDREHQAYSDLWRAVIVQAIRDMAISSTAQREKQLILIEAIQWIDTQDFDDCCALAFIDGAELRDRLKEMVGMKEIHRRLLLRSLAEALTKPPPRPCDAGAELDYGLAEETEFDPI
jgi:hypothetical protein